MVVRLADCDCSTSPYIYGFPLDVLTTKIRRELNDGIGDGIELGINGSCKRSLNAGGVNGGHDVSHQSHSITFS
jgi:hypothetical protein